MSNLLHEYLNKRLKDKQHYENGTTTPGPLITVSREVGCSGVVLAEKIAGRLNHQNPGPEWKVLSKEVFYQSARELNMEPEKVKKILRKTERYTLNDILNAFGDKKFKSEKKIIKTVSDIIYSFADEGFCILVGRAAHIIARDIKNALHLRITAPLEYRINAIMEKKQINLEDTIMFINKVESERLAFRMAINPKTVEDDIFDLHINKASFSDEGIIDLVEFAARKKNIFKDFNQI